MIAAESLALAGKINKTHGIGGELSATFYSDALIDAIKIGSCLIFDIDGIYTPFFVSAFRPRSSESLLIQFDGITSQESAAFFVGHEFYMDVDLTSEDEELSEDGFYAGQLIGYKAINDENNTEIGEIVDIDEATENVLFIIETPDGKTVYIPVADELITDISTENHIISFELPEGLLSL